jgi:hypothetical protein
MKTVREYGIQNETAYIRRPLTVELDLLDCGGNPRTKGEYEDTIARQSSPPMDYATGGYDIKIVIGYNI